MGYVAFILLLVVIMGLNISRCMRPHSSVVPSKLTQPDANTYPPQKLCHKRNALLLWKASPMMDWLVTKVTKMHPPYPPNLPIRKNICSVYTFVNGCSTMRFVVTDFKGYYFNTQTFAARYMNGSLLNISVTDRTFVLRDEHYQIYSAHITKLVYAKADGTLENELEIPESLKNFNGEPILLARVAENKDKWAIFQMCNQDVTWVAVSTEKTRENPKVFLKRYEAEIEMSLRQLNIDTSTMVDVDDYYFPFEPANTLPPYRVQSSERSSDGSPSGSSTPSTSRRLYRSDSHSDSDISGRQKRRGRRKRFRVVRVPRHSKNILSDEQKFHHYARDTNDYTNYVDIRLFVGSWNVNGQPPMIDISKWLSCDEEPPDIYAIGFQELDRSKEALLFHNSPREEEWLNAVVRDLHPGGKYRKIALVRLVGMMLIVFTKMSLVPHVKGVDVDTAGTGVLGKLGNKGGVAVRFELFNTSVCFVNVHLAAHVEGNEKRNQNYHDICSRISFRKVVPPRTIEDHDQVYWFGDLNYRITQLPAATIKQMIDMNQYDSLMKWDQLSQNQMAGHAFNEYEEGRIAFRPTYKYDIGTNNWDSSKKSRTPSWCDRIVWKGKDIEQLSYRNHLSLSISDHKPISAVFATKFRVIDKERFQHFRDRVTKQLDTWDTKTAPQVMVSPLEVNFGDVQFMKRQTKTLKIFNKGHVSVLFKFKKKPNESRYCKDWLRIEMYAGSLKPGDEFDVNLNVYVDKKTAHEMNSGEDTIEDTLVLHFEAGNDVNVQITGTYKHSCFGSSLDVLSMLGSKPINQVSRDELIHLEKQRVYNGSELHAIPVAIASLVEHLYQHGMREERLFEQPGVYWELLQIRDWLDDGVVEPIPDVSIHSVAEALLLLLDSTPEPLIPYVMHQTCLRVNDEGHNCKQCKQIISSLSTLNKNIFLYLCTFLQDLLLHTEDNMLDPDTMVTLFGEIFLRRLPEGEAESSGSEDITRQRSMDRKRSRFMFHILVNLADFI